MITLERTLEGFLKVLEWRMRQKETTDLERRTMKDISDFVKAELPGIRVDESWRRSLGEHDRS